ncbi:hypothetical protein TPHA_0H00390 [Tetrapisispora phaffii CBS 4417]|uniref:Meiotic nuclear division protein 1 n=1 Tax=Tetrapisispora phaffii (strain ATCC 24235 / CBS 4417 / NBRC 1672 / NRRL Y-8282 / UCD 70-5) TaxID=1071381 RepID=G8BWU5_TETPH|nr:hypothetical protein TPHA_0H00390 [Tetrapisispora phaffii CBS 4417]CCE64249.1 hypothetical protein TPHA_0H00390 [Tetrapisispora phaffii CBS 4417]
MGTKKGCSIDEKKQSILNFFQNEYSFYTIKELEKLIPKKCPSISSMVVKELLQAMIDEDGLISVEKCGNINVYWCFKNQINQKIYENCTRLQKDIEEKTIVVSDLELRVASTVKNERAPNFTYDNKKYKRLVELDKLKKLDMQCKTLQNEYDSLMENLWDEQTLVKKIHLLEKKNDDLNILSDNIDSIISYLVNKYLVDANDIRKEYGIQEEYKEYSKEVSGV